MTTGDQTFRRLQSLARSTAAKQRTAAPTQELLTRHLLESFLHRLTLTPHQGDFILKGGIAPGHDDTGGLGVPMVDSSPVASHSLTLTEVVAISVERRGQWRPRVGAAPVATAPLGGLQRAPRLHSCLVRAGHGPVNQRRDEGLHGPHRCRADHRHAQLVTGLPRLGVEVIDDLHVITHETDGSDHHPVDSLLM